MEEVPISGDVTVHGYQTRYQLINVEKFVLATQKCPGKNPIGKKSPGISPDSESGPAVP